MHLSDRQVSIGLGIEIQQVAMLYTWILEVFEIAFVARCFP
jgi:hypothetical protein